MTTATASKRDARVDVLRGLALVMIFVDHVPGNSLNRITLHNFGFCDAAEIFVTLAGFSSVMAYGTMFAKHGTGPTLRRIGARCLRIYAAHIALVLLTLAAVASWTAHFRMPALAVAPILAAGWDGVAKAVTLQALPGYLDILPLYIVLLAAFPLIHIGMRRSVPATLAASALVWLAANIDHRLNLPNWMDGKGWYFNPFTWQLLFAIGAATAVWMRSAGGAPGAAPERRRWLAALCWAYLVFAFFQGASWADWGLPSLRPLDMATPDKSSLSPLRIIDIMALLYLFITSKPVTRAMSWRLSQLLATLGKHSLEVFAVGCAFAMFGRLMMRTYGAGPWNQVGLNVVGFGAMAAVAIVRERSRARDAEQMPQTCENAFQKPDFQVYRAG